ncbi:hypothetical protein A2Z33_00990 [Candidatus Gottesmanbacteria bacterium RBG_16_52_11]|uniref:Uncharacterized protein n=1 Tax=Candidatus Gottesmanbacteria bacterium RBG_16_52_11 TaxID=1798374 RepID=A0A1F5YPA4_9BACT|nr:MAG: hypothetical protein A2Z33_00990 [Candidatus Gottesmanbacteria bacterium RBG_16_52_11]
MKAFLTKAVILAVPAAILVPGIFAGEIVIKDNGADSVNKVEIFEKTETAVEQANVTEVQTIAVSSASSGDVEVKYNTGGGTFVHTGDAGATTKVKVYGSSNTAIVDSCGCGTDPEIKIRDNGADSYNKVEVKSITSVYTGQANVFGVSTIAGSGSDSGNVEVKANTGSWSGVVTGSSWSKTKVTVKAPKNFTVIH